MESPAFLSQHKVKSVIAEMKRISFLGGDETQLDLAVIVQIIGEGLMVGGMDGNSIGRALHQIGGPMLGSSWKRTIRDLRFLEMVDVKRLEQRGRGSLSSSAFRIEQPDEYSTYTTEEYFLTGISIQV